MKVQRNKNESVRAFKMQRLHEFTPKS